MPRSLARVLPLQNLRRIRFARATALRRAARRAQPAQVAAVPFPNAGGLTPTAIPMRTRPRPTRSTRVQASGKFPEPLLNTPKIGHGADQGSAGGQERHHAEAGGAATRPA